MKLSGALRSALLAGVRVPSSSPDGMARYWGASAAEQNRAIAESLGVTMRTVQRWRTSGAQRRAPRADLRDKLVELTRRRALSAHLGKLKRTGVTVDLVATILVSDDLRRRDVTNVAITAQRATPFLDAAARSRWPDAADEFALAFGDSYGLAHDFDIVDVDFLRIRPLKRGRAR